VIGGNWNAIEIAGPATRNNLIEQNMVRDTHQSGIEADKGASYNDFVNNVVDGVTEKLAGSLSSETNAGGMRAQGFVSAPYAWTAKGNRFVGNTVRNVTAGATGYAAGVEFQWAEENEFIDTAIDGVTRPDGDGHGVLFFDASSRNRVRGGSIANAKIGVMPWHNNTDAADETEIDGVTIRPGLTGIKTAITSGATGSAKDWRILNCHLYGPGAPANAIELEAVNADRPQVSGCRIRSFASGIVVRAPAALIENNTIREVDTYGIATQAGSDLDTVVRNNLVGPLEVGVLPYSFAVQTQGYGNRRIGQSSGAGTDMQHSTRVFTGATQPTSGMRGDVWWDSDPAAGGSPGAICTGTNTWKAMPTIAP
jgi:hypothetical protein